MILPRHWARAEGRARTPDGKDVPFALWRWSERSLAEAQASAAEAIARVAARIGAGQPFPDRYTYGDRPAREEVIRVHEDASGAAAIAITRNTYGALVLNTARVMFLDFDLAEDAPADPALERLRAWAAASPGRAVRVYRTKAGYRYLVTHDLFDPVGAPAHEAMAELGIDEKYRALCRVQQSFRARLTPKPWRVGMAAPKPRWPYATPAEEADMRTWLEEYAIAIQDFAVCELVEEIGSGVVHPEVAPVLALHDEMTKVGSGLPLA